MAPITRSHRILPLAAALAAIPSAGAQTSTEATVSFYTDIIGTGLTDAYHQREHGNQDGVVIFILIIQYLTNGID